MKPTSDLIAAYNLMYDIEEAASLVADKIDKDRLPEFIQEFYKLTSINLSKCSRIIRAEVKYIILDELRKSAKREGLKVILYNDECQGVDLLTNENQLEHSKII